MKGNDEIIPDFHDKLPYRLLNYIKTLQIEFLRVGYTLFIFTVFIQIDFEENMILFHAKRTVKTF